VLGKALALQENPAEAFGALSKVNVEGPLESVHGWTPLHVACSAGEPKLVRALCDSGASVEARSKQFSHTPLHVAASLGHSDCVRVLAEFGAVFQAKDEAGFTALHLASAEGYRAAVEELLRGMQARDSAILVNERDAEGNSALVLAQRASNAKIVETIAAFISTHLASSFVDDGEVTEITEWLTNTVKLPQYVDFFIQSGYTRLEFLAEEGISDEEFEDIGIMLKGHRKIVRKFLKAYRSKFKKNRESVHGGNLKDGDSFY